MKMERPKTATARMMIGIVLLKMACSIAGLEAVNTAAAAVTPRAAVIQR